ncbi:MAG: ribosome maturation factor RimP [Clostridiales bacterium]|nr:ribosome maturation factor RimP [Clostridiales bacterium]MBR4818872.1 ribosome maturation factor RimP [Clostridiales bacterium]MBR5041155.1 ribosome maturation factor RimP [Clostridiales bacterium]MBR5058595.1 ribosome maturation factor RimP [Clostridiales bacterium]
MAGRSKVAQEAFDIAEPIVKELGFDLVDCEYKKEGQYYFLRIFIDKRGGIGIDDCELVSREVDKALEGKLHADPDYFEVSSPGATRPFSSLSDYVRHQGEEIEVSLFSAIDGSKHLEGIIEDASEEKLILDTGDKKIELEWDKIAKASRTIRF